VEERVAYVQDIEDKLKKCQDAAELYNSREAIFALPPSEYPQLKDIQKDFDPYATLWRTCGEFTTALPGWMDGPFTDLDAEAVTADMDKWSRWGLGVYGFAPRFRNESEWRRPS
jgi:dynein heavy chain